MLPLLLAAADAARPFGARDIAGLVFIALAIIGIWSGFRHTQALTESPVKPPDA